MKVNEDVEVKNTTINPFQDKTIKKPFMALVVILGILIAGFMIYAPPIYMHRYHPEIPPSDFLPYELAIVFICGTGVLIGISLILFFAFSITAKLFRKIPLGRSDAGIALNLILNILMLVCVYMAIKLYYSQNPEMTKGTWVAVEFFACCISITFMPIIGMIPIGMVFNFFWGRSTTFGRKTTKKITGKVEE
jgi:predicted membrane protein